MTGFGKAVCEISGKKINVEIKSLNSKQFDMSLRIPFIYKEKELELRNELSSSIVRGKIDLAINIESSISDKITQLNTPVIENYYNQLSSLSQKLNINENTDFLRIILTLPDSIKSEQPEFDESEWANVKQCVIEAVESINNSRIREGALLETDIKEKAQTILELLSQVEPLEQQRLDRIKTRIRESIEEIVGKANIDENRFEQELIYYIEKFDVSEEKVRLKNHIDYFFETIKNEEVAGKLLGFITQEMGREINTLGSKANDADIQKLVIKMKDELEKIKEQTLNVL